MCTAITHQSLVSPHLLHESASPAEHFLSALFDRLWTVYKSRVTYVQAYEKMVAAHGATFFNDHIAFRTFAWQRPTLGIVTLSRLFEVLGYRAAGSYQFEDKHLAATHFQHANPRLPKIFISELQTWKLPADCQEILRSTLAHHRQPLGDQTLTELSQLSTKSSETDRQHLLDEAANPFLTLPWPAPEKQYVLTLNKASQYAAWVLVHGYQVNHFTSLVNSHGLENLSDLESTIAALKAVGVPMKAEIEGAVGTKLRQTATEAVTIDVDIKENGAPARMPWSYAYFELAQRDILTDSITGTASRFEGFLGPQATNLFEMTRTK